MANLGTRLFTMINGQYVGKDEFGNQYYQARREPKEGRRRRWVIYNGMAEPTKVPPHWHGWLHYTTKRAPVEGQPVKQHKWQKDHVPNLTGTPHRYVPKGHVLSDSPRAKTSADYVAWKPE